MNLISLVPLPYRLLLIALAMLAAVGFGWVKGAAHEQTKSKAAQLEQQVAVSKAVFDRLEENRRTIASQRAMNDVITKGKNDELVKVRADINAERLRLGAGWCGELAGTAEASSSSGGDAANTGSRILPESLDRATKALIMESEEVAATGRACKLFLIDNGFAQ